MPVTVANSKNNNTQQENMSYDILKALDFTDYLLRAKLIFLRHYNHSLIPTLQKNEIAKLNQLQYTFLSTKSSSSAQINKKYGVNHLRGRLNLSKHSFLWLCSASKRVLEYSSTLQTGTNRAQLGQSCNHSCCLSQIQKATSQSHWHALPLFKTTSRLWNNCAWRKVLTL